MEPFHRIKKIKGIEYWYEVTPYYDPVSKQTRYKNSKYLGRNVDGKPVRMRSAPTEVTAKVRAERKTVTIRSSYEYGSVLILKHIMQAYPAADVAYRLFKAFGTEDIPYTAKGIDNTKHYSLFFQVFFKLKDESCTGNINKIC